MLTDRQTGRQTKAIGGNLFQVYLDSNIDRIDEKAVYVNQNNTWYTHRQIIEMVETASSGLVQKGYSAKSKIGIMLNGSIEEVIAFLAIQKIGAIAKYIDYMKSVPAMKHSIEEDDIDCLIMDKCFLPLNSIINTKGIRVLVANTTKEYKDENVLSFEKLYEIGKGIQSETVSPEEDKVCLIINSSGTTGNPKPICHTSGSVNAAVRKMLYTDYPICKGNVLLKMIPSQIGLGIITSLYTGLVSGCMVVLMVAKPESDDLIRDINDFVISYPDFIKENNLDSSSKINVFTAPLFARGLINDERLTDLSYIGSILAAGSKMGKEELDTLENIARNKGCKVPICNGYGQNEMAGAVSLNTIEKNVNGSAGILSYGTDLIIVNPETYEILGYNETGLILERSDSVFKEYDKMPEKTEESKIFIDGTEYFNSCDLGYMDENGFLFITGRTTRVVIRCDFKISLDDIEEKVNGIPVVKDSAATKGNVDGSIEQFNLFVEISDCEANADLVKDAIRNCKELSPFEQPNDIIIVDKIPYKDNGKKDYMFLEKMLKKKG